MAGTGCDREAAAVAAAVAIARDIEAGRAEAEAPSFALGTGTAGHALLFHALGRAGALDHGEAVAHQLIDEAAHQLRTATAVTPSLYVGWAGVAFATAILLDEDEAARRAKQVTGVLRRGVGTGPWRRGLDLVDGLAGLGVLALALSFDDDAAEAAASVVRRFDELARPVGDGIMWRVPGEQHAVAVGLAHGVAGIVSVLAACHEADVARAVVEPLLDGATTWLLSLAPTTDGRRFPAVALADAAVSNAAPDAWCWGDVGVSLAIARAARARGRTDWTAAAVDAAIAAAARSPAELGIVDACFCHGSAGVAHVLRGLAAITADERLTACADRWVDEVLAARRPGTGVGGFTTAAHLREPGGERRPYGSLQLGAAGTALALLASCGLAATGWDQAVLVPTT